VRKQRTFTESVTWPCPCRLKGQFISSWL